MKDPTQAGAIITLTEFAQILGVTRQGAHGMADRDPTFPPPICTVSGGKTALFWRKDAQRYAEARKAKLAEEAETATA